MKVVALTIMVALVLASHETVVAAPTSAPAGCVYTSARQALKDVIARTKPTVDPLHIKDGIAVSIVSTSPSTIQKLHTASEVYLSARTKATSSELTETCNTFWKHVNNGSVSEAVMPTSTGLVVVTTATRPDLVTWLQDNDCCDWCGPCGPNSTAGCCRHCLSGRKLMPQ